MPKSTKKSNGFEEWEWPLDLDKKRDELEGRSLNQLAELEFGQLGQFKQAEAFPHGYDRDYLTFYAPRDGGVHQVLLWALLQAKNSVAINMYGFADGHMVSLLRHYAHDPKMIVTLSLDSSEAGSGGEPELLEKLKNDLDGNSIAIGRSEKGAISHDKLMVVDGLYLVTGSTNWSFGGEVEQDNQLTLARDPIACAEARAVIDLDHDFMLKKMAEKAKKDAEKAGKAKAKED
ncbi:MAG TPA: phospholipase D-like domain-containing protein [Solirubrobacterales bacterium]|nr:phospholipase D-like domain-containing protein [Solirubrobacterales bacterium]